MGSHDFRQPVLIDHASAEHPCSWCGKPALYQFTVQGEASSQETGFFCQECGDEFVCTVADSLYRILPEEQELSPVA